MGAFPSFQIPDNKMKKVHMLIILGSGTEAGLSLYNIL